MPTQYTPVITGTKAFNLINTSDLSFVLAQVIDAMEYKLRETAAELGQVDDQILADMYNLIAANDALVFKGVLNGTSTSPGAYTPAADCGHVYKVATGGYINGQKVEIGDTFICTADSTPIALSGTYSTVQNNWIILQTNADGIVIGPASATSGRIVTFNGTTGKLIQDSGKSFSTATPSSTSTDNDIPTSKAVWGLIDGLDVSNISGFGAGKTLSALSETNGKISATFQDISIAPSQINDTIPVSKGGTGMTTTTNVNAIIIGNSTNAANAMQTVATNNGAFYATAANGKPQFGTLPVAQGGTGATSFTANSVVISGSSTTSALTTRAITNNTTNTSITNNNTNIPTMNTIYYGLVAVNGNSQSRATTIYVPTTVGSNNQYLKSTGSGGPSWQSPADSSSASAISSSGTNLVTERDIYYGLPTINNSHAYTSSTTIYAPTAGGTSGYYLKGAGTTTAPTWQEPSDSSSASAISTGTALATERDIYYGLPTINGVHNYTSSTTIYAPIAAGTEGQILSSSGSGAPTWVDSSTVGSKIQIVRW